MLSRERIAKLPRYCRNYAHETQKCPAKDGGARIICAISSDTIFRKSENAYTYVDPAVEHDSESETDEPTENQ